MKQPMFGGGFFFFTQ